MGSILLAQGKFTGVSYFDYSYRKGMSAFNFNRQYFSYGIKMSEDVNFKVVFDVGRTDNVCITDEEGKTSCEDQRLVVFLKKAQVNYTCSFGKTSLGMIGTNTYGVQEKNWGYRFIEKSAIDKNKFSSTADIGFGLAKTIAGNLHLNLQVVNGEGYKKPQGDNNHKVSLNASYGNLNLSKSDGFNMGTVLALDGKPDMDGNAMISVFGGFAGHGLRIGGEFDLFEKEKTETSLISASLTYGIRDNIDIFARIDSYDKNSDPSIKQDSEIYIIAGTVFNCGDGLSVGPNVRVTSYEDKNKSSITEFRINLQFRF